jgi:hypothetical protein
MGSLLGRDAVHLDHESIPKVSEVGFERESGVESPHSKWSWADERFMESLLHLLGLHLDHEPNRK